MQASQIHGEKTAASPEEWRRASRVIIPVIGILAAVLAANLVGMETRWIVYFVSAIGFGFLTFVASNRQRFLFGAFLFSMQADVSLRIMYGHAGSAGLVFPAPVLLGVLLTAYEIGTGRLKRKDIIWFGRAKLPILLLFATTVLAIIPSNEHFVGVARLLFELQLFFVYWLALNFIRTRADLKFVMIMLFAALFVQAVVYVIQSQLGISFNMVGRVVSEGQLPRPGGTVAANPAGYASFIIPPLMIAMACYLRRSFLKTSTALVLLSLGTATIILSLTRAAWGSVALGFMCVTWLSLRRGRLSMARPIYLITIATALAILCAPLIAARFAGAPLGASYDERRDLMSMATRVIEAHPVTGVGPGAYESTYKSYVRDEFAGRWMYTVHNEYLLRTAETGVPGGLAWVLFLLVALRLALRASRSTDPLLATFAIGASGAIVGLCFEMYWDAWIGFTYNAMLWYLIGIVEVLYRSLDNDNLLPQTPDRPHALLLADPPDITA